MRCMLTVVACIMVLCGCSTIAPIGGRVITDIEMGERDRMLHLCCPPSAPPQATGANGPAAPLVK